MAVSTAPQDRPQPWDHLWPLMDLQGHHSERSAHLVLSQQYL
jgi:hypothetical protein